MNDGIHDGMTDGMTDDPHRAWLAHALQHIAADTHRSADTHLIPLALAAARGGHYMDQFTHAERATDRRGNHNIAESLFAQMQQEPHPLPRWIVVGPGPVAPRPPSAASSATSAAPSPGVGQSTR